MWGTLHPHCLWREIRRFIPTDVGNTPLGFKLITKVTVHPHGCGEHGWNCTSLGMWDGSSPRMWGTHRHAPKECSQARFIPTDVGNTLCCYGCEIFNPVHPHGCGEHTGDPCQYRWHTGSSPRMWGTLIISSIRCSKSRFIPTDVGNTSVLNSFITSCTVHPHGCGEHHFNVVNISAPVRFIPTDVGNTAVLLHVLGLRYGSSPRMWGTHSPPLLYMPLYRFIPTDVGNTPAQSLFCTLTSVHPHGCGEH